MDVGFEVCDYGGIGVELLDEWKDGRGCGRDVDAAEAKEGEFAAVVVVLFKSQVSMSGLGGLGGGPT